MKTRTPRRLRRDSVWATAYTPPELWGRRRRGESFEAFQARCDARRDIGNDLVRELLGAEVTV